MDNMRIATILSKLEPLLGILFDTFQNGDYAARREAAIALSKFKGERATDFLLKTYETDNIQDFLALALGNIESEKAISLLVNALNDSQQEVRFNAAQALGMIKNDEALNVLLEALNEYADANVTGGSQQSGGKIFFEEDAIISAITAVGKIRSPFGIPLMKRLLAQEKSGRIRSAIIMALGGMANERMLPIFQGALRDEDSRVRANAIEAIESIKSTSIVGIIQPYLEDPSNRVRANVAKAIFKYGDFDVSETLGQMLKHTDKWFRGSAAYAMGEIRDVHFIPKLAKALKDEDPDVRRNAANALRKIESPNAFPHLVPLLEDPNHDVRVQAVIALSRCSPDKSVELLVQKLQQEENPIVKATLISCLGDCAVGGIKENLLRFLNDPDPRVVSNTIEAAQKLTRDKPDPRLVAHFKELLAHEDNRVKSNAIKTLWNWDEISVLDNLQELFQRPDLKHRQSAVFVLGEIGEASSKIPALRSAINDTIAKLIANREQGKSAVTLAAPSPASLPGAPVDAHAGASADGSLPGSGSATAHASAPAPAPGSAPGSASTSGAAPSPVSASASASTSASASAFAPGPDTPAPEAHLTTGSQEGKAIPSMVSPPPTAKFDRDLELATNAVNSKEFASAEKIFQKVLAAQSDNMQANIGIANLYFQLKRYPQAAVFYEKILRHNPNSAKAHYNLGTIFFMQKDHGRAKDHLLQALAIYPKLLGGYLILAQIYQLGGLTLESIKLLSKAIELSPRNPILYQKLAMLHIHIHEYKNAIGILTRALSLSPLDVEANLLLAFCYHLTESPNEAFDAMDATLRACAQSPQPDESLKALLQSYLFVKSTIETA
ncbi:hypothetical protein AUK22_07110 [bacterium CG2_30_54_10]|nr:MAG: hypothetical protein AUK22_07110 [bacterium CG2_30_54_10]